MKVTTLVHCNKSCISMSNQATQIIFMPMVSDVLQRRQQQHQQQQQQSSSLPLFCALVRCRFLVFCFFFFFFVSISQITCEFCINFFLVQDLPHAKWPRTVCSAACDAASVVQMCKSLCVCMCVCVRVCVGVYAVMASVVVVVVVVAWAKLAAYRAELARRQLSAVIGRMRQSRDAWRK